MMLMQRRRALLKARENAPVAQLLPSCLNWFDCNNRVYTPLTDNSFELKVNNLSAWNSYCYATRTLTAKYADLIGKTVVVDYDFDDPNNVRSTVQFATTSNASFISGASGMNSRSSLPNPTITSNHYHAEVVIGVDYIATNVNQYLSLIQFVYSTSIKGTLTVTNFKCYIKS